MKKVSNPFRLSALAIAMGATAFATQAQAQIEEIVVTAEFREANVQDTPIAITAMNSELLEARNHTNIFQVAAQAPNVTLVPAGQNRSGMVAYIRGIGQSDFNFALEPGVGIYVDDVYYPTLSNSLLELIDLDRVEVLRGPQGTLAGRNSIGGAIKLYSIKPGSEDGGRIEVKYGSLNEVAAKGSADFTIAENSLYGRISIASKQRDGYVDVLDYGCVYPNSGVPTQKLSDGCKIDEFGNQSYVSAKTSILWTPSSDLEVNFSADVLNDNSGAAPTTLRYGDTANPNYSPLDDGNPATPPVTYTNHQFVAAGPYAPANALNDFYVAYATHADNGPNGPGVNWKPVSVKPKNTMSGWGASINVNWDLNDTLNFVSITSYREYESFFNQDEDLSPIAIALTANRVEHWSFTQEFRLNGSLADDVIDYTVGAYYLDQEGIYEGRIDLNYAGLDFIHGPDPTPSNSLAFFGHSTWHINDTTNLSLGLRWSDEEKDYRHSRRNPNLTIPNPVPNSGPNWQVGGVHGAVDHFEDDRIDYRVALDHAFSDNVMAYAQVSTGYKGGGVNPRPFFPEQAKPFGPEELTTYEIGMKTTLLDNRMRLNGAIFSNDYQDIQLTLSACEGPGSMPGDPPAPPCLAPRNVGSADVEGFEIEMQYYPTDQISIDASYSAIDFQYSELDPFALQGSVTAPLDMIAPYTPESSWSLGAQYDFPATRSGQLSARLNVTYQDEMHTDATNTALNLVPDYTLSNLRLIWNSPEEVWQASFEVNNLADKEYIMNSVDQVSAFGGLKVMPGLPRTYALTIRRNFSN